MTAATFRRPAAGDPNPPAAGVDPDPPRAGLGPSCVAAALYAISALWLLLAMAGHGRKASRYLFDFTIYQASVRQALDGGDLYATVNATGFGFTYPPGAAIVFAAFT